MASPSVIRSLLAAQGPLTPVAAPAARYPHPNFVATDADAVSALGMLQQEAGRGPTGSYDSTVNALPLERSAGLSEETLIGMLARSSQQRHGSMAPNPVPNPYSQATPAAVASPLDGLREAQEAIAAAMPDEPPQPQRTGRYTYPRVLNDRAPGQWDSQQPLIDYLQKNQAPVVEAATPAGHEGSVDSEEIDVTAMPPAALKGIRHTVTGPDGATTHRGASLDAANENMQDLLKRFDNAASGAGMTKDPAKQAAQYDHLVELIRQYGREAEDSDPTAILPMFAALAKQSPELRQSLLRKAGNPEAFATLNGDGLADIPSISYATDEISALPPSDPDSPRPTLRDDEKTRDAKLNQTETPTENKPQSWMTRPDALHPQTLFKPFFAHADLAVPQNAEQFRAFYATIFSAENADLFRAKVLSSGSPNAKKLLALIDPANVSGADEAMHVLMHNPEKFGIYSSNSGVSDHRWNYQKVSRSDTRGGSRGHALTQLIGDQEREIGLAELQGAEGANPAILEYLAKVKKMPRAERQAAMDALREVTIQTEAGPQKVSYLGQPKLPPPEGGGLDDPYTLKRGTKADPRNTKWLGRGREGKMETDDVVAFRNLTQQQQIEYYLYQQTPMVHSADPNDPSAVVETLGGDTTRTVNLDILAPWVRARYGQPDAGGNVHFPDQFLSAETVTNFLQHTLKNNDPDFVRRMLPLIERSLAALPEKPSTKSSQYWATQTFLPNNKLVDKASKGKLKEIHGVRNAGQGAIEAPQRHGFTVQPFEQKPTTRQEDQSMKLEAMREKIKAMKSRKPGNTDQSSIYQMNPATSPLRSLIA